MGGRRSENDRAGSVLFTPFQLGPLTLVNRIVVAPSAVKPAGQVYTGTRTQDFVEPRALETEEVPGAIEEFTPADFVAQRTGFDGVEIHGANGYIVDQFLRDRTNLRTDMWGGSIENRVR